MVHRNSPRALFVLVVIASALWLVIGCAGKRAWYGDPETGLTLEYRFPEKKTQTYRVINDFTQTLEIMGQTMEIDSRGLLQFSLRSKGVQDRNHHLEVTVDSLNSSLTTPRGVLTPDTGPVRGKSFDLILSLIGEELELIGTDELQYEYTPTETRSVGTEFQALFPKLPHEPVKVGESWTSRDTVSDTSERGEMQIAFEWVNTIAGFEMIDGWDCVKITNTFTGRLTGTGKEGDMDLISTADIGGTGTYYFAYKKGMLVRDESSGVAEGTTTVVGPQEMEIPLRREFKATTELVRK